MNIFTKKATEDEYATLTTKNNEFKVLPKEVEESHPMAQEALNVYQTVDKAIQENANGITLSQRKCENYTTALDSVMDIMGNNNQENRDTLFKTLEDMAGVKDITKAEKLDYETFYLRAAAFFFFIFAVPAGLLTIMTGGASLPVSVVLICMFLVPSAVSIPTKLASNHYKNKAAKASNSSDTLAVKGFFNKASEQDQKGHPLPSSPDTAKSFERNQAPHLKSSYTQFERFMP